MEPGAADADHAKMKQENQLLLKKLHDVVARYKQLQQQYQAVVSEKEHLLSSTATTSNSGSSDTDATSEMAVQDAAVKKLEAEKHELIEKLKTVVGTCRAMQKQLQEAKEENEILKSPAKPLTTGASASSSSTSSTSATVDDSDSSRNAAFAAATRVQELERALAAKKEEKQELVTKLQEVIARYHTLQQQLEEKIGEHEAAISKVRALELELRTREAASSSESSALQCEVEQLTARCEVAETHASVARDESERLKHQLASALDDKQQQERELTRQVQDAQHDNDRLVAKVSDLQHQVAQLQQQQEDAEQLYTEVASRLNQTLRTNSELEAQLRTHDASKSAADDDVAARIRELTTLLENANSSVADLERHMVSESSKWERERAAFADQVAALTLSNEVASARIKHLEALQTQLESPDLDVVNYEIISPSIDFPKREEIQALAEQVHSLQHDACPTAVQQTVELTAQYDEIRVQMIHIRKRQNSLLAAKESDVLELEQLRETISHLVDEHESALSAKDAACHAVVQQLEIDKSSLESSVKSLTTKLVDTEARALRDAEQIARVRTELHELVAIAAAANVATAADSADVDSSEIEQILVCVKQTVVEAREHRQTVCELTTSISALREQLASSETAASDESTRAARFELEVQTLTAALQALQDENARLNSEIDDLRDRIERVSDESDRLVAALASVREQQVPVAAADETDDADDTSIVTDAEDTDTAAELEAGPTTRSARSVSDLERQLARAQSSLEESESVMASVKAENMRMIFEVAKSADGSVKLKQDYESLLEQQKEKAAVLEALMRELEAAIAAKLELESELRESQGSLNFQINELHAEKQELRDSVRRLEDELQRLRTEKAVLEQEIADLKSENDTLEERIHELHATKSEYDSTDEKDEKDREVEELRSSLVQAKVEFEQQTRQLTALEKKVAEVSSRAHSPSHHTSSSSTNTAATEAERKEFQAALIELIDMERKLQTAYETQKSLEAALKEKSESKALLEAKLADAEQSLADLEDELEHKMRVSGTIETHLKYTENENQDLMKEHEQVLAKLVATENLLEEKSIAFEAFRTTSDMLKDERSRLYNEIAMLKELNVELEQQSERAASAQEEAHAELEEQLTELADKIAQLETDKSEMKQSLERELFQLEDELEDTRGWRKRAESENTMLLDRVHELESAASELEASVAALEQQNSELAAELADAHASFTLQIGAMETQAEQTMHEITLAMREKETLEATLTQLEADKRAADDAFAASNAALEIRAAELEARVASSESELVSTQRQLEDATANVERTTAALAELERTHAVALEQVKQTAQQELDERVQTLESESDAAAAKMSATFAAQTAEWTARHTSQQDELAALRETLQCKESELMALVTQSALAEQKVSAKLADAQAQIELLEQERSKLEEARSALETQLFAESDAMRAAAAELQQQIDVLRDEAVAAASAHEDAVTTTERLANERLAETQTTLQYTNERLVEAQAAAATAASELLELRATLAENDVLHQTLEQQHAALQTQLDAALASVRNLEKQVATNASVSSEVASLTNALADSKTSFAEAQEQLTEIQVSRDALVEQVAELQASRDALVEQRAALQKTLEARDAEIVGLEEQVADNEALRAQITSLEVSLAAARTSLESAEERVVYESASRSALVENVAALQSELDASACRQEELRADHASVTAKLADAEAQLASARSVLQDAEQQQTEKDAAHEALTRELVVLRTLLDEQKSAVEALEAQVADRASVDATLTAVEQELASAQAAVAVAEQQVAEKHSAHQALATEQSTLTIELEALRATTQQLEAQLAEKASADVSVATLEAALAELRQSLDSAEQQLTQKTLALEQATRAFADLDASVSDKDVALQSLTTQCDVLQSQLTEREATGQQLQREIESLHEAAEATQQTLDEIQQALAEREQQLAERASECEALRAAVATAKLERESLAAEAETLQSQIATSDATIHELQVAALMRENELTESTKSVETLSLQVQELKAALADQTHEVQTHESEELAAAREQVATLSVSAEAATAQLESLRAVNESDTAKHAAVLAQRDEVVATLKTKLEEVVASYKRLKELAKELQERLTHQTDVCATLTQERDAAVAASGAQAKALTATTHELAAVREDAERVATGLRRDAADKLQSQQQQHDALIADLETRARTLEAELTELQTRAAASAQQQYEALQSALATQEQTLQQTLEQQLAQTRDEMVAAVQAKESEAQEVLEKMREVVTRYRELQEQHRTLQAQHDAVASEHASGRSSAEAELLAAHTMIEQLRTATASTESDRAAAIASLERELQALRAELAVESEAAGAARGALEAYKKRAHTALKKATSESKLNVKKASDEVVVLEQKLADATARMQALESELTLATQRADEVAATTAQQVAQSLRVAESEQQQQEATWRAELESATRALQDAQMQLQSKDAVETQLVELRTQCDSLQREVEMLRKELQSKSEVAREMLQVKDSELAALTKQLEAARAAATAAVAAKAVPLRIDSSNNNAAGPRTPSPVRLEKAPSAAASPSAHSDTSRTSSVDPADDGHTGHIAAAVAEHRAIPLLANGGNKAALLVSPAASSDEALRLKSQLASLEAQTRGMQRQLEDTTTLLEETMREKKRLQLLSARQTEGVNVEYLKNVVIKYMESSTGSEKERLLPVIATVLQFSPQEMRKVNQKLQEETGSGLLGGVFSLFGGGGGSTPPAPKPLTASLSRQPSTSTISGGSGPRGSFRFDEADDDDTVASSLNPFAA